MQNKVKKKVFVALSGGVDSSVAALLLKKRGYEVIGVFMRCFNLDGCAEKDARDALRVARYLKIPFYIFDFEKEYKKRVVEYMINGYCQGITPNPDIMCNQEIKFGLFLEKALNLGADFMATGHYARLKRELTVTKSKTSNKIQNPKSQAKIIYKLYQAKDKNKDQSYFLWTLTQKQLKYCLFPIGNYLKSKVREIAKKAGLPTAEKKDSQGICFLGKIKLIDFLKNYLPKKKGPILTTNGQKIGEHQGVHFYTIGQRHLGVKFQIPNNNIRLPDNNITLRKAKKNKKNRLPYYVAQKDVKTNILTVAEGINHPSLYKKEIKLANLNFINPKLLTKQQLSVCVRTRYRQPLVSAKLIKKNSLYYKLVFKKPQKFIAPGQSAVFYSTKEELLGGGVIKK